MAKKFGKENSWLSRRAVVAVARDAPCVTVDMERLAKQEVHACRRRTLPEAASIEQSTRRSHRFTRQSSLNLSVLARVLRKVNRQPFQLAVKHAFQQFVSDVKVNLCGALRRRFGSPRQNPACQYRGNHVQDMFLLHVYLPAVTLGVFPRSNQAHSGIAPALHYEFQEQPSVGANPIEQTVRFES